MNIIRGLIGVVLVFVLIDQIASACESDSCHEESAVYTDYYDPYC